ncbi:tRNA (mo5U34)-methyltransferase [Desulfuromonas soudanensis]|uniref:tRNA (Mo5U34)-methyltransferase n=1 Tax=Desulfuromonas soudanensis TaxID=1603606 RepID=A0A0M4D6K0_9BACT|nr:tRNA 5-methoxyuridine(34)/uridine 5-oxyacetic acid(34) synthase CmoB [Desulfuromonas soudanensis]ALC16597.1 tRNA (mo5U34)-methyltransferase [Desulfuromonas soudanensis]
MTRLSDHASEHDLGPWETPLRELEERKASYIAQVDAKGRRYLGLLDQLPEATPSCLDLSGDRVQIGTPGDLPPGEGARLFAVLRGLSPWRKGPFEVFGTGIDSEWVSSLKWNRLQGHIAPLTGRRVLDIGSSNGYYLFRMAAQNPAIALGIEPYLTFYFQYLVLQRYARVPRIYSLPARFEEMPALHRYFDTIFCMGMLYHRRSPIDTLSEIRQNLRRGGELVLETLVIAGEGDLALIPRDRYAKMNNVYFLPTVSALSHWLERAGFEGVRCIDLTPTTSAEQRRTDWVQTESLADFLDPDDPGKTVEGYPAPLRAIFLANAR